MDSRIIVTVIQIVLSVLLTGVILLQAQGSGLGSTWGGGGESYHTKRGLEKTLFFLTIILTVLFFAVSVVSILIS